MIKFTKTSLLLAFKDINPQAKVHVLVIPKGAYVDMNDFAANAKSEEIEGLIRALGKVASILGVSASGYRYLGNNGSRWRSRSSSLAFSYLWRRKIRKNDP